MQPSSPPPSPFRIPRPHICIRSVCQGYRFEKLLPMSRDTKDTYQLRMRWRHISPRAKRQLECRQSPPKTHTCQKKSKERGDFDFWRCTQILWTSFINDWHGHTPQDSYWRLVTNQTVALSHTPHQSLRTVASSNFQRVAVYKSLRIMCTGLWTTLTRSSLVGNFPLRSGYSILFNKA